MPAFPMRRNQYHPCLDAHHDRRPPSLLLLASSQPESTPARCELHCPSDDVAFYRKPRKRTALFSVQADPFRPRPSCFPLNTWPPEGKVLFPDQWRVPRLRAGGGLLSTDTSLFFERLTAPADLDGRGLRSLHCMCR